MFRRLREAHEEKQARDLKIKQGKDLVKSAGKGDLPAVINILSACDNNLDVVNLPLNGTTALDIAAARGHLPIVSVLLKIHGIHVNNQSPALNMNTPLISAIIDKHVKIVEAFAEAAAVDPNLTNQSGENALTMALMICPSVVPVILKMHKLDINAVNRNKNSALHYAVKHKSPANNHVAALLAIDAIEVDLQNNKGHTPLMLAAKKGDCESFAALLEAGASLNKQDHVGLNARKIAELYRHKDIIDIIDKYESNKIENHNQRGLKR